MKLDTGIGIVNGTREKGTNIRGNWRIKCDKARCLLVHKE